MIIIKLPLYHFKEYLGENYLITLSIGTYHSIHGNNYDENYDTVCHKTKSFEKIMQKETMKERS